VTKRDLFTQIALQASVPVTMAMVGFRLGIGRALTGIIIAELFGSTGGLGHSVAYYAGLMKTTEMMTPFIIVVCIGVFFTQGLAYIE